MLFGFLAGGASTGSRTNTVSMSRERPFSNLLYERNCPTAHRVEPTFKSRSEISRSETVTGRISACPERRITFTFSS